MDYRSEIKTYRLMEGELYNIDLEDKDAYEKVFDNPQNLLSK